MLFVKRLRGESMKTKELYDKVFPKYMAWVDKVSDDLEDKTHFTPEEIVYQVVQLALYEIERQERKDKDDYYKYMGPG